jgi:ankyrin repeat protein
MDPGIQVDSTSGPTALHYLACMSHTDDIVTHEHQVILARQLIENGADVKAVSDLDYTPLHYACMSGTVTNLEFIQLLLENGADPNALTTSGKTPLLLTSHLAPAAAKFLIEWPGMNINHVAHSTGVSSLALVCMGIEFFSNTLENAAAHVSLSIGASVTATLVRPNFHRHAEYRFLLQQWREIKDTLEDMGAIDSGVRRLEY